jgi:hypothetical protein
VERQLGWSSTDQWRVGSVPVEWTTVNKKVVFVEYSYDIFSRKMIKNALHPLQLLAVQYFGVELYDILQILYNQPAPVIDLDNEDAQTVIDLDDTLGNMPGPELPSFQPPLKNKSDGRFDWYVCYCALTFFRL